MAGFFQIVIGFDEVTIKDLILHRYSNFEYVLGMDCSEFLPLLKRAIEAENEQTYHDRYCAILPYMHLGYIKYEPFGAYKDRCTGKNIDMRPDDVILKEIEELHNGLV